MRKRPWPAPLRLGTAITLAITAAGCTITQTANPVALDAGETTQICVVQDPRVDASFLPAFVSALNRKGLTARLLPVSSALTACPLTATYNARWSWDFTPYMAHATVTVYRNGARVGDALYDAPKGGSALTTRIYESTESKVGVMVDQLFPELP